MMRYLWLVLFILVLLGCSTDFKSGSEMEYNSDSDLATAGYADEFASRSAGTDVTLVDSANSQALTAENRKIIYTANLNLVVEDFDKAEQQIQTLIAENQGYVAQSRRDRTYGNRLAGHWTVRLPVERFAVFVESVEQLGVPETFQTDAQDVSQEFVDLEARLKNKRRLEERIIKLVEERTGKIGDVVEVERELARVREEIERMQGRLLYLRNRVEMTTVTISMREDRNYTPPQAPTFATQIHGTFGNSITAMQTLGQMLVLCVVAVGPWLVLLAVLLSPVVLTWKILRRRSRTTTVSTG